MDAERFHAAHNRLEQLDERLTYKIRRASEPGMGAPTADRVDERLRDLASYTLELKEIVQELFDAIAAKS